MALLLAAAELQQRVSPQWPANAVPAPAVFASQQSASQLPAS